MSALTLLRLTRARLPAPSVRAFSMTARRSADPWPLPHTPEHLEKTTSGPDTPAPTPLPRPGEPLENMRARLVYQSRKRGTLESDLLLSTFAQERLATMDEAELHEFDKVRRPLCACRVYWESADWWAVFG